MSKIKIQGNASGTGVLTVTAPNTSTDRTITLPDSTGTLATTADVPAGISSSADATAITIDSRENVGIGVVPENDWYNGGVGSEYRILQLGTGAAVGGYADNSSYLGSNWKDDASNKYINTDEASLYKQQAGVHSFLVAASGSADAAITWTTGFEVLNDGKARAKNGLLFGTDTATANALDDYEEGTATLTPFCQSGSVTLQSTHNTLKYTKIGNKVFWQYHMRIDTVSSPSGWFQLRGLPFANASGEVNRVNITGHPAYGFSSPSGSMLTGYIVENATQFLPYFYNGSTGVLSAAGYLQANTEAYFSGSYSTT